MIVREPFDPLDSPDEGGGHSLYQTQRLPDYGAGRLCARCRNGLRRSNPGPLCDPCRGEIKAAKLAGQELPLLPDEVPMTVQTRRPELTTEEVVTHCDDVLALLRGGEWWTTAALGDRLGVSRQRVFKIIGRLREAGHEIVSEVGVGTRLVREAPAPSVMVCSYTDPATGLTTTSEVTTVPASPTGRSETADSPSEPSANAAGACAPTPRTLPPFAGITTPTTALGSMVIGSPYSREVRLLCELDALDDEGRERVLCFAVGKWWGAS